MAKKILHVSVVDKIATYQKRDGVIVCGNNDYQIKFTFDEDWTEHDKKFARFLWLGDYYDQEISGDNTCDVPVIKGADSVEVGVYAGDLETTTGAEIPCLRSILCKGGTPHPETGQHYTNEAVAAAEAAKASETSAKASEENASASATISANSAITAQTSANIAVESASQAQNCMEITQGIAADYENIDGRISRNSKRISNLEKGITPSPFKTDETVAHVKYVPAISLPYAELQKVGGMSYAGDFDGLRSAAVTKVASIGKNFLTFKTGSDSQRGVTYTKQADGGIAVTGTPTGSSSTQLAEKKPLPNGIEKLYIYRFGDFSGVLFRVQLFDKNGTSVLYNDYKKNTSIDIKNSYPDAALYSAWIARESNGLATSGTIYPMLSVEVPQEFEQYKETSFVIPEAVQALDGYGLGISADINNNISWDDDGKAVFNRSVKSFVISSDDISKPTWVYDDVDYYRVPKPLDALDYNAYSNNYLCDWEYGTTPWEDTGNIGKTSGKPELEHYWFGFAKGTTLEEAQQALTGKTIVYQLATPEVIDISDLITPDNIIGVVGGGTIWFVNQYNLAPTSTVTYQTKEEAV